MHNAWLAALQITAEGPYAPLCTYLETLLTQVSGRQQTRQQGSSVWNSLLIAQPGARLPRISGTDGASARMHQA